MPWYGINHVHAVCRDEQETTDFYTEVMGFDLLRRNKRPDGRTLLVFSDGTYSKMYFFSIDEDGPHPLKEKGQAPVGGRIREEGRDPEKEPYMLDFHHVAWGVESEEELHTIKEHLDDHDVPNWGPINRSNFAFNLYFEDPNGLNLEIHTPGPKADVVGDYRSETPSEELPETKEEVSGVEQERSGVVKEGAEDGLAKELSSSFWEKT